MRVIRDFLFISLPVLVLGLILVEFILQKWFPVQDPYLIAKLEFGKKTPVPNQYPVGVKYQLRSNEGLPGIDSSMKFTTNNFGFRGDPLAVPKPANEFRIFMVGGSTTECFFLDDSKSLNMVLQKKLQSKIKDKVVKVYNAGVSGTASPDHLAILSQRIVHLQPDLIIVFSGLNDFRKTLGGYDYLSLNKKSSPEPEITFFKLFATGSQIARRLKYALSPLTTEEELETITFSSNYHHAVEVSNKTSLSTARPVVSSSYYKTNLRSIVGICRLNSIRIVFMTNQSTWNSKVDNSIQKYHWMNLCRFGDEKLVKLDEGFLDSGLNVFNNVMRNVSTNARVPLYDLAGIIPKSTRYFYDDCHFNINGAHFTAEGLTNFIIENKLVLNK